MSAAAADPAPPAVVLASVAVRHRAGFGEVTALSGLDLNVEPGSSVGITGPSGCGKSTLLALVAGFTLATEGRVIVDGVDPATATEAERTRFRRQRIGMVFQVDNLLPFLTVAENVALSLDRDQLPSDPTEEVETLLERLGLGGLGPRLPDELSGGQRQRAAVAAAVVHRPALLLCDEPTGALDRRSADSVMELLVDQHRSTGTTLVVVTHDERIADRCRRRVRLDHGRVVDDREVSRAG